MRDRSRTVGYRLCVRMWWEQADQIQADDDRENHRRYQEEIHAIHRSMITKGAPGRLSHSTVFSIPPSTKHDQNVDVIERLLGTRNQVGDIRSGGDIGSVVNGPYVGTLLLRFAALREPERFPGHGRHFLMGVD